MRYCFPDELFGFKALMRLFVLFISVCGAGCGASPASDPGSAAQAYIKAPYSERYKYVQKGASFKNQMAEYYAESPLPTFESVKVNKIADVKPGASIVWLTLKRGEITQVADYYVKQTGSQWLVDWPATIGFNPTPLRTFKSTAVRGQRATFRVLAQIADLYGFQYMYARDTHYSIRLVDQTAESIDSYVQKRSKIGQELYDLLRDAGEHKITATVRWNGPMDSLESGNNVDIISLVSKTWFAD